MIKKIFLFFRPFKLSTQLAILMSSCLTISILSYGWYTANQQSQTLIENLRHQATGLAQHLSVTLGSHLLMNDYINVEKILISAAKATPIDQIQVVDKYGLVITDVRQSLKNEPKAEFLDINITPPLNFIPELTINEHDLVLWHPIAVSEPLAWLHLKYSLTPVNAVQSRIRSESIMAAIAAIAASLALLAIFLSPRLAALKQIRRFAETMNANLGRQISIEKHSNEITLLGEAMNDASIRLARSDDALKKSEEHVRLLLDSTAEAILGFNLSYKCTFVNPACLRILDYDFSSEVVGQKASNVLLYTYANGKPLAFDASPLARTLNSGLGNHAEDLYIIRSNGLRFPIEYWSYPIHHNGTMVGAVVTFVDITERKNTEKALWHSEKIFRDFAEKIPSVFWMISPNGERMIYISPAYEEIWGRSTKELYSQPKTWMDAIHKEDIHLVKANLAKRLTGEYDIEYRIVRPDLSIRWVRDRGFPIFDNTGQIERIAGIAADITSRKKAEQTEREHQAALAVQSALETQNEEFRAARLQALQASKAKSDFLANISHEIRTPMHAILGFTNILQHTPITVAQKQYIDTIENSASTLLNIINNILDFSKIEAGKINLEYSEFNVCDCIDYVVDLLKSKAITKGINIFSDINPNIEKYFWGDATRLKQILTNLIDNAIKFTSKGNITIQLKQLSSTNEKIALEFKIIDTGIGISSEHQAELFSTFFQVDTSETRPYSGAGLGLAICKRLIEQMDGEIGVVSEQGKGSTFWIKIIFKKASIKYNRLQTKKNPLENLKILLCDWHPLSRSSLAQTFESWGMQVTDVGLLTDVFTQLEEGELHNCKFEIVVIAGSRAEDEILIGRAIKHIKKLNSCPLIVLHPYAESPTKLVKNSLTADAYLPRHCRRADLLKEINRVLFGKTTNPKALNSKLIPTTFSLSDKHVLVADDNVINRTLLVTLLQNWGARIMEAENGEVALRMIQTNRFDIVLLDIHMPILNGMEVATCVRENGNRVPIVALTADMLIREKNSVSKSEFNDILVKPVNKETIIRVMKKWLKPDKNITSPKAVSNTQITSQLAIYDQQLSIQLANGKQELAMELLQMLLAELPQQRSSILQGAESADFALVKEVVHKLHGSASYCGLPALKAAAANLEKRIILNIGETEIKAALKLLDFEIDRVLKLNFYDTAAAPI